MSRRRSPESGVDRGGTGTTAGDGGASGPAASEPGRHSARIDPTAVRGASDRALLFGATC
ncbi:hypothetical protein DID99_23495 [Burkholderia sp. Bp8986]|nr:hypothetical protein DID99_23495 [Burkholderia sp. Bp8986]